MIGLFEAAKNLQDFCDNQQWKSCFIGGIAVQRWGAPRVTLDADLTLLAGFGNEAAFIDPLLNAYQARIQDAKQFALQNRVLLLRSPDGVGIDISLGALPLEEAMIERATVFSFGPELDLRTCSAEDLIILKLFSARPLDIHDAEGVALRNHGRLDWTLIERELIPLAEINPHSEIQSNIRRIRELLPQ